jgi:hypothetical protein
MPDEAGQVSPTATQWLTALPTGPDTTLPDDTLSAAIRAKLRLPLASEGLPCAYTPASSTHRCGFPLGRHADHAHACCRGPVVCRHNRLRDWWTARYRDAGFHAETEQVVPELMEGAGGAARPAVIADVRATRGPGDGVRWGDVAITHPVTRRGQTWTAEVGGRALARKIREKRAQYSTRDGRQPILLVPLVMESFGRLSPEGEAELRLLARLRVERIGSSTEALAGPHGVAVTLQRWRQELGCLLQRGNRHVWSAAMGSALPGHRAKSQLPPGELVDHW